MKIEILYTTKSKHVKPVATKMAMWAKTYAKSIAEYDSNTVADLLIIAFDDSFLKDKELYSFIQSLNRNAIKNVALCSAFYINDKKMQAMITLCQQTDLPLMREQYSWKITWKQLKTVDQCVIDGARLYIEDMVNIIRNYY